VESGSENNENLSVFIFDLCRWVRTALIMW
jgi:hypothetical protein